MSTEMTEYQNMTFEQAARVDALRATREVLADRSFAASKLVYSISELLMVADWIITGQKPLEAVEVEGTDWQAWAQRMGFGHTHPEGGIGDE